MSFLLPEIYELLELNFYLSHFFVLMYKMNTLVQVGTQVSHQEHVVLPSQLSVLHLCVYICVFF
jgi:hypothetical protein